jgi:hypothetical protein
LRTWLGCSAVSLLALGARADVLSPSVFQHGVCYAHAWRGDGKGYGSAASRSSLERLRALGVDAVSLTPFGYQPSLSSERVQLVSDHPGGENDRALAAAARQAHALGMRVMLKPHIWVRHGEWIGRQALDDSRAWARWFDSYRALVLHYARLAADEKMELFCLGTELAQASTRDRPRWQRLIAEARAIYPGTLLYAANWDEAERVVFWDLLDAVGVQEYEPPTEKRGATLDDLRAGWRRIAAKLEGLARRTGRPVVVTEVGYRAVADAALAPSAWPELDRAGARYDGAHQALCYRAALEVLTRSPWCGGVYVWKWFSDSSDESGPTDFSPAGKPAEAVLREFFRAAK